MPVYWACFSASFPWLFPLTTSSLDNVWRPFEPPHTPRGGYKIFSAQHPETRVTALCCLSGSTGAFDALQKLWTPAALQLGRRPTSQSAFPPVLSLFWPILKELLISQAPLLGIRGARHLPIANILPPLYLSPLSSSERAVVRPPPSSHLYMHDTYNLFLKPIESSLLHCFSLASPGASPDSSSFWTNFGQPHHNFLQRFVYWFEQKLWLFSWIPMLARRCSVGTHPLATLINSREKWEALVLVFTDPIYSCLSL